jgi:hypothetical protein
MNVADDERVVALETVQEREDDSESDGQVQSNAGEAAIDETLEDTASEADESSAEGQKE